MDPMPYFPFTLHTRLKDFSIKTKMLGYSNILTVNPNDVQSLMERIFFWRIWKIYLLDIFDYIQWELSIELIDGLN